MRVRLRIAAAVLLTALLTACAGAETLDGDCTISVLNRTARVREDGSWQIANVPVNFGLVRARATCSEGGVTRYGQSDRVSLAANAANGVTPFGISSPAPIPRRIAFSSPPPAFTTASATAQLRLTATYPDATTADVTAASTGTSYTTSNARIATVSPDGLVTAVGGGTALITALNDGAIAVTPVQVVISGADTDGDGIPDDVELNNGLNPRDPIDALEDPDADGLDNLIELMVRFTDPRNADTDGDGFRDGLEVQTGSNPLDPLSFNLAAALRGITMEPASFTMVFNTVRGAPTRQLRVTGQLLDFSTLDITRGRGVVYGSSDPAVCSFAAQDGIVSGGQSGTCTVTASVGAWSAASTGTVDSFAPVALGTFSFAPAAPESVAGNVDVNGSVAYMASGKGLYVVDVAEPGAAELMGHLPLPMTIPGTFGADVRVAGSTAYVAGRRRFQVVDTSDPVHPRLLSELIEAPTLDFTDLVLGDGVAYVADSDLFAILDVSYDPVLRLLGSVQIATGGITGVAVDLERGIAVAVAQAPVGGPHFYVIEVRDPEMPAVIGTTTMPDLPSPRDVTLDGSTAYVADFNLGLTLVDLSDLQAPLPYTPPGIGVAGRWMDVEKVGDLVLGAVIVFTPAMGPLMQNGVVVADVRNPALPAMVGNISGSSGGTEIGIAADPQFVYSTNSNHTLLIGQYQRLIDEAGQAPAARLITPAASEVMERSTLIVTVAASDDVGVKSVDFLVNGVTVFTDTAPPYQYAHQLPRGTGTLRLGAIARDFGDNTSSLAEKPLTLTPDPPPQVSFATPAAGASVIAGSTVPMRVDASDNRDEVVDVTFFVDGQPVYTDPEPPYVYHLQAPSTPGTLVLGATARLRGEEPTSAPNQTLTVVADALTTVTGQVLDAPGNPLAGATVSCLGVSGVSAADGSFSIAGVPTLRGNVYCKAAGRAGSLPLIGRSQLVTALPGGTSAVGSFALDADGGGRYPAPAYPVSFSNVRRAVGSGDFNEDGAADLVLPGTSLSVLLGNGSGGFGTSSSVSLNSRTASVLAVGHFDADAHLDVVTPRDILRGVGNGTFLPRKQIGSGTTFDAMTAADFNSDGKLDLARLTASTGAISLLLGHGNGTFQELASFLVNGGPRDLASGDFDGDGDLDLATVHETTQDVAVLLGNGAGGFVETARVGIGGAGAVLAAGDLDADDRLDLVAVETSGVVELHVLLGNGAGGFIAAGTYAADGASRALALFDADGNGTLDVVALRTSSGPSLLFPGNGDGTLQAATPLAVNADGLLAADLNGDTIPDLAAATATEVVVLAGHGDGGFDTAELLSDGMDLDVRAVAVARLDADAIPDVVAVTDQQGACVYRGAGDGRFATPQCQAMAADGHTVVVADVNGDGIADVVAGDIASNKVAVRHGDGTGGFSTGLALSVGEDPVALLVADVDADSRPDIVTANANSNDLSVLLGNAGDSFAPAQSVAAGEGPEVLAAADLDGNGTLDLVVGRNPFASSSTLARLLGNGDGSFGAPQQILNTSNADITDIAVGYLNGDTAPDLVVTTSSQTRILLGSTGAAFTASQTLNTGADAVALADVTGDGILDLVSELDLASSQRRVTSVFTGAANGTFTTPEQRFGITSVAGELHDVRLASSDLDGDGAPEIVGRWRGGVRVMLHR